MGPALWGALVSYENRLDTIAPLQPSSLFGASPLHDLAKIFVQTQGTQHYRFMRFTMPLSHSGRFARFDRDSSPKSVAGSVAVRFLVACRP